MNRRTLLKLGAAGVSLGAVGGGVAFQRWRAGGGLSSDRITGPWDAIGPGVHWLLPDLDAAPMVVPDRPHDVEETRDPARRRAVTRTRAFTVTTSPRRLRGDRHGPLPAAGKKRIVAIGDSVTFGWGVSETESWPAQLEAHFGGTIEVLNAGVPAQRLEGLRGWLQHEAPKLGVHGVLFARRPYPMGHDPLGMYAAAVNESRRALPQARFLVLLPPVSQFDPKGMREGAAEEEGLRARLGGTPLLDLTATMRAAQGDRGCRLEEAGGEYRVKRGNEVVLAAPATERGLPTEIYSLFERDPSVREALFFDDGHPDAEGFAALIPAIADAMKGWT